MLTNGPMYEAKRIELDLTHAVGHGRTNSKMNLLQQKYFPDGRLQAAFWSATAANICSAPRPGRSKSSTEVRFKVRIKIMLAKVKLEAPHPGQVRHKTNM